MATLSDEERAALYAAVATRYVRGHSYAQITKELRTSNKAIQKALALHNVSPRRPRRQRAPADVTDVGRRLRALRQQRKLTQSKLAASAGISQAYVQGLENGANQDLRVSTLRRIAAALGVKPSDLLD